MSPVAVLYKSTVEATSLPFWRQDWKELKMFNSFDKSNVPATCRTRVQATNRRQHVVSVSSTLQSCALLRWYTCRCCVPTAFFTLQANARVHAALLLVLDTFIATFLFAPTLTIDYSIVGAVTPSMARLFAVAHTVVQENSHKGSIRYKCDDRHWKGPV